LAKSCCSSIKSARDRKYIMKALILYVVFVAAGAIVAGLIGYYVEIEVSATASLIVFLALFFTNFVASWIAVIFIMDGSLQDAQGRQAQMEIERRARGA
jgi:ethanolamine transporter EutH